MICHDYAVHPWNRDLERRVRVLKLLPAYVIKMTDKNDTNIHPNAAIKVKTSATEKICAMGPSIGAVHCSLDICLRKHLCRNPVECVVRRAGDVVEKTDRPRGTAQADPIHHVALAPARHGADAGVPEGPQILLRGDRHML